MPKKRQIVYRAYNWNDDVDPVFTAVGTIIQDSQASIKMITERGGASQSTLYAWKGRKRSRGMFDTIMASVRAAGGDIVMKTADGRELVIMPKTKIHAVGKKLNGHGSRRLQKFKRLKKNKD